MALKLPLGVQRPRPIKLAPHSNPYAGYKRASKGPSYLSGNGSPRTLLP